MVELTLLGGIFLQEDGKPVSGPVARRHPLALLALLTCAPGSSISRSRAIDLLWPEVDKATGRNRLSTTVYTLRRLLGSENLASSNDSLHLNRTCLECDLWRFTSAIERDKFEHAANLYTGRLLEGFFLENAQDFEEYIQREQLRISQLWISAVRRLAESAETDGDHGCAAQWWQLLANHDPLDSDIAGHLVSSLAANGNTFEAICAADKHVKVLYEELSVEPDQGFLEVVNNIRRSDLRTVYSGEPAIAVLVPESPEDDDSRGLAEGVHSGILSRLTTLDGITVISRSSVAKLQERVTSVSELSLELGVQWVLEGSAQARKGRFRLGIALVNAPLEKQVWAEEYRGELTDENYFNLHASIASEVVARVQHQVTPGWRRGILQVPTVNASAHRRHAIGTMYFERRSKEGLDEALRHFEEAAKLDSGFASAWAGIAATLITQVSYRFAEREVLPRAAAAITEALERDPRCAKALTFRGLLEIMEAREQAARETLKLAAELRPGYAETHNLLCLSHHVSGEPELALESANRAVTLNPLSVEALVNSAVSLIFLGRTDDALEETNRALDIDPLYDSAHYYRGLALYEAHRLEEAIGVLNGLEVPWAASGPTLLVAMSHLGMGDTKTACSLLPTVRNAGLSFDTGILLAALGRREAAIQALDSGIYQGHDFVTSYWPIVCLRYLFKSVWASLDDGKYALRLLDRICKHRGLPGADVPAMAGTASRRR